MKSVGMGHDSALKGPVWKPVGGQGATEDETRCDDRLKWENILNTPQLNCGWKRSLKNLLERSGAQEVKKSEEDEIRFFPSGASSSEGILCHRRALFSSS